MQLELEKTVHEILDRIYIRANDGERKFRCHEFARILAHNLGKRGYPEVKVNDGLVTYDVQFLKEVSLGKLAKEDNIMAEWLESIRKRKGPKSFLSVVHSWCELEDFVVDYHCSLKITPNYISEGLLIVKKKEDLEGKACYDPLGKEFSLFGRTFVYIPLRIIKLRIKERDF